MKRTLLASLILLFSAVSANAQICEQELLNNAPYKIRVPAHWNGVLLLYAHGYGYLERYDENQFNYSYADAAPGGAAMEDFLLAHGYALAGTVFSGSGWQVKEGTHNLISLLGLFNGCAGKPDKTILIGYSLGGLIAMKSAEEVPLYDGVIQGCSLAAGSSKIIDQCGAFALAYEMLFGWPAEWGTWYDPRDDLSFYSDVFPVLYAQVSDPANIPRFEFLRLLFDSPLEGFYELPGWLFLDLFVVTEARAELEARAKGPVAQNADQVYELTESEKGYLLSLGLDAEPILAQMNTLTAVSAAKQQRQYLEKYYDPTGDLQKPLLSMHSVKDGFVPAYFESSLLNAVKAASKEDLLLQVYTNDLGHCTFTPAQLLHTIEAMEYWLNTGMRPGPEFFPEASGFVPGYVPGPLPIGKKQ